jgi:hypothetical protein
VLISEGYQITLATASCDEAWYGDGTGYWNLACPGRYLAEAGLTTENSTQPERSHEMLVRSLDYIGDHLDRLPTVLVARWARIVGLWKPVSIARLDAYLYERDPWDTYLQQATWYPAAALAVVGVVVLRRRGTILLPVLAPFLVVFITITVTYAQNRYRAATEPVVALLAAVGVERLWRAWRQLLDDPHAQPEAEDSPALGVAPASSSTNVTAAANNSAAVSDGR